MVDIKTKEEIEIMRAGGKILAETLWEVMDFIKPGVSEKEVDALADRLIVEKGGEPGFKKVEGYSYATCISTNDVVVHGIPSNYVFKDGDIVGVDCGVFYKGFHTDMSHSKIVGNKKSSELEKFLEVGERALNEAILQVMPGNRIGHISKTIQDIVEKENGYSVVRSLIGHGVGRNLHEDPEVPGYLNKKIEKTPLLKEGMTIAVEVIYNMGSFEVKYYNDDNWTISTEDGSLSGLFERTVLVTEGGVEILTK
jgi:methionyl aminopeptidase